MLYWSVHKPLEEASSNIGMILGNLQEISDNVVANKYRTKGQKHQVFLEFYPAKIFNQVLK